MLDANARIIAEKESFSHAFTTLNGSNLTYRPGRVVCSVSAIAGRPEGSVVVDIVVTDALGQAVVMGTETYDAQLLNVIPPHRAGPIVQLLGLADPSGYAPVDGRSFETTVAGKADIHVIGTLASWLTAVYRYQQDPVTGRWKYVAIDQVSGATGATEARSASTGSFSKMNTW